MAGVTPSAWPAVLWLVRHGESAGNVARNAAVAGRREVIDLDYRDVDVPLSPLGERQSAAVGTHFGALHVGERPTVAFCSPFVRARETARLLLANAGDAAQVPLRVDERLREKEFGVIDGLTSFGIEARMPEQAALRRRLGKFYHRPPGGESWCDVLVRLRSFVATLSSEYAGERVLVISHTVVVLCTRYLLESMNEQDVLAVDRAGEVANASLTIYDFAPRAPGEPAAPRLRVYNEVTPLEESGATVTAAPDDKSKAT